MAFPVEEGLKHIIRAGLGKRFSAVFMAFPVEEGLKPAIYTLDEKDDFVFMAFPVEEGLKPH